ncbi:MAG: DUF2189 domain-containing protein [Thiolinea sp.]
MVAISENGQDLMGSEEVVATPPSFKINTVSADAPMRWLEKGLKDYRAMLLPSTLMGLIYVLVGGVLIWTLFSYPIFITTLAAAFLMIGPLVAVGFYNMSNELEQGRKHDLISGTISGWSFLGRNLVSLCCFALVLGVLMGVWALVSAVSVALFFDTFVVGGDVTSTLMSQANLMPFMVVYLLSAIAIAIIAFSISVVSAPLITNRKVDFVTAMITSVETVKKNPSVMLTWGLMIAAMILVGFLLGFVGLAVTLPIVGHASWHAYRELVVDA